MALVSTEVASAAGHTIVLTVQYDDVSGALASLTVDNGQNYPVTAKVAVAGQTFSRTFQPGLGQVFDLSANNLKVTIQHNGDVNWPPISLSG